MRGEPSRGEARRGVAKRAQAPRARRGSWRRTSSSRCPSEVELPPETGETFAENAASEGGHRRGGHRPPGRRRRLRHRGLRPRRRPRGALGALRGRVGHDEENLAKLLREVPEEGDRRVAYVCVLAYVPASGGRGVGDGLSSAAAKASCPRAAEAPGASGTTRPSCRTTAPGRTMAELDPAAKDRISHRGRAARELLARLAEDRSRESLGARARSRWSRAPGARARPRSRSSRTAFSSRSRWWPARSPARSRSSPRPSTPSVDLLASVIAFFSVRKAEEPADDVPPLRPREGRERGRRRRGPPHPRGGGRDRLRVGAPARGSSPGRDDLVRHRGGRRLGRCEPGGVLYLFRRAR